MFGPWASFGSFWDFRGGGGGRADNLWTFMCPIFEAASLTKPPHPSTNLRDLPNGPTVF